MNPPEPLQWPVIALGATFLLAILAALWKCAPLRGDYNRQWAPRVDLIEAGLKTRAVGELSVLRRQIDALIGGKGQFDPNSATADPAPLLKSVRIFERCMAATRNSRRYFGFMLGIAPAGGLVLVMLLVGDVVGTVHLSNLAVVPRWLLWLEWLFPVGIVLGVLLFAAHWFIHGLLTEAEILSTKKVSDRE